MTSSRISPPQAPLVHASLFTDFIGDQLYGFVCPTCGCKHTDTVAYPHRNCENEKCGQPLRIKYPDLPLDLNPHEHPPIEMEESYETKPEPIEHPGSGSPERPNFVNIQVRNSYSRPLREHPGVSESPLPLPADSITSAIAGNRGDDQQRIAQIGLEWIDLILRKNQDYGSAIFKVPELVPDLAIESAILVRIHDKIERLKSLAKKRSDPMEWKPAIADESFEDTIRDLGAYCLLYLARPKPPGEVLEVPPGAFGP